MCSNIRQIEDGYWTNLGPKRGWTEQANLEMTRKFHEEMLKKAHSYIGKELDEQNRLLNEFGEDVDEFNTRFGALGIGMQKLLKTNNNCYLAMICFLSITFGIMLFVYVQG